MTKNIKEIGKELLGKSLNSFHKKTGLTQLEKNNEVQDGILDGILSQVDDAYIEKTEQSNVMHLDGSGDGVVVLDSIEGNTMVNLRGEMNTNNCHWVLNNGWWELNKNDVLFLDFKATLKPNSIYTIIYEFKSENDCGVQRGFRKDNGAWIGSSTSYNKQGLHLVTITTTNEEVNRLTFHKKPYETTDKVSIRNVMILEGDWTNKELPTYFEGLQSSFEEQVEDNKYKIEILSHKGRPNELKESYKEYTNINPTRNEYVGIDITDIAKKYLGKRLIVSGHLRVTNTLGEISIYSLGGYNVGFINPQKEKFNNWDYKYFVREGRFRYSPNDPNGDVCTLSFYGIYDTGVVPCVKDIKIEILDEDDTILATEWCPHYEDDESYWLSHKNSNKIKLLINEPLRAIGDVKDKLCVKDNRLIVERNCGEIILDGNIKYPDWHSSNMYIRKYSTSATGGFSTSCFCLGNIPNKINKWCSSLSNNFITQKSGQAFTPEIAKHGFLSDHPDLPNIYLCIGNDNSLTVDDLYNYMLQNPIKITYQLLEPYYEEVLNEHGEPILLEGYENGTIYIDSTIVPTTTVRYTPKMESLNTLKEVNNNNVMLTNDINDMIVPYMMEVDLMIMEKEVALMSRKNIRKIGAEDMTNMQKRTQQMLERLIKGRTLTEQECQTRVTTYLNANKITDEQAEELMLLINEVYA